MMAKKWSVSGLAVEVGLDRRTVGRIINEQNVREAGEVAGAPVYRLRDFLAGWRSEIEAGSATPEQQVLEDWLREALHALRDISGAGRR